MGITKVKKEDKKMKVLIWPVTPITTHHKKAKSIEGDESEGFSLNLEI